MNRTYRIATALCLAGALSGAAVAQQRSTVEEIERYRAALGDGNPAELWEMRGEGIWKEKRGPKKESLEKIFTPIKDNYAYGWTVTTRFNRRYVGHGGSINGFVTDISRYPDDRLCVVVLSNLNGVQPGRISRDLAAIAYGEKYEIPVK